MFLAMGFLIVGFTVLLYEPIGVLILWIFETELALGEDRMVGKRIFFIRVVVDRIFFLAADPNNFGFEVAFS